MLKDARWDLGVFLGTDRMNGKVVNYYFGVPMMEATAAPVCLAGVNARPAEDVVGPPGYIEFLNAMSDPSHQEHKEMLEGAAASSPPPPSAAMTSTQRSAR